MSYLFPALRLTDWVLQLRLSEYVFTITQCSTCNCIHYLLSQKRVIFVLTLIIHLHVFKLGVCSGIIVLLVGTSLVSGEASNSNLTENAHSSQ